jgi:hypothetical protein
MPLFVSPEDVILRMQLDAGLTGITEVITSGIMSAQLKVERIIDGKLARQSQNCGFFIDAEAFSGISPGGLYRLEIPSGMVREDVPQVVTTAGSAVQGPFGSYDPIDTTLMKFDFRRGYLYVDSATYGNHYVKVQCDTGYEDGTRPVPVNGQAPWSDTQQYAIGDVVSYLDRVYASVAVPPVGVPPTTATFWIASLVAMESVPDAIYEAIMSLVPMVFNAQQTTNRSNEAQHQYQMLTDHANLLLQPYARTQGFTFRSI